MTHLAAIMKSAGLAVVVGLFCVAVASPSMAQCPNNCTGHGTCVPSQKNKRLECDCYDGWTGSACSQHESASAKAKKKEDMIVDLPEDDGGSDSDHYGRPIAGVREFKDVAKDLWSDLQPREQVLLKDLGWKRDTWNGKNTGKTMWPAAMHMPFNALKRQQQSAVGGLGLTPKDWNTGEQVQLIRQYSP